MADRLAYAQPESEPIAEATPTPESTPTIEADSELDEPTLMQQQDDDDDPPVGCPAESVLWSVPTTIQSVQSAGNAPRMLQPQNQTGAQANWVPVLVASGGTFTCKTESAVDMDGRQCTVENENGPVMPSIADLDLTYKWKSKYQGTDTQAGKFKVIRSGVADPLVDSVTLSNDEFADANIEVKWVATDGAGVPVAPGQVTITCTIDDSWTGTGVPTGQGDRNDAAVVASVTVTVYQVASVDWEQINSEITANTPGEGGRIFPDLDAPPPTPGPTPTPLPARNIVRVKALITPVSAGKTVYFKAYDVDDPSPGADKAPLDQEGWLQINDPNTGQPVTIEWPAGTDNRGSPQHGMLQGQNNTTRIASATTDQNGYASLVFTATMQPGDNFRIAASCNLDDFDKNELNDDSVPPGIGLLPASVDSNAKLTPMLTIWRRLHVEVDSMGAPVENTVAGLINRVVADPADGTRSIVTTDQTLTVRTLPTNQVTPDSPNRFVPGILRSNGQDFTVVSNESGPDFRVTVQNLNGQSPVAGAFELFDDDDPVADVPDPAQDKLEAMFRPAFIQPVFDGGGNIANNQNNLPFHPNFRDNLITTLEDIATPNRQSVSQANFWTIHCYGAFQERIVEDNDPNTEGAIGGISSRRTAFTFYEQLKEFSNLPHAGSVLTHEVGHSFGLADEYRIFGTATSVTVNGDGTASVTLPINRRLPQSAIILPSALIRMNPDGSSTNDRWSVVSHTAGTTITVIKVVSKPQVGLT